MTCSAASIASLPPEERARIIRSLSRTDLERLSFEWRFWARPEQLEPPGDWLIWLILAGRGFGKTRSGAEWVRQRAEAGARRIIIAGPTAGDLREAMIEGESGILAVSPPWNRPKYEPSKLRLTWPNGARATLISADEPERFRNKQADTIWCDELAAWPDRDAWDQLQMTFRLVPPGKLKLRCVVTTTPKPKPLIRELVKREGATDVIITRGSTYDNRPNLSAAFYSTVVKPYEGTRLGRQELNAEILDDVEGALWSRDLIEQGRKPEHPALSQFARIVVAIDPAVTANENSDETGIVVAGMTFSNHYYVLADASGRMSPLAWARTAISLYRQYGCDRIVAEENNGGALVEANLRTVWANVPYSGVRASTGKRARAEPVVSLYERGLVHHVGGLPKLEDQLCTWEPNSGMRSPDRLDALVWAMTDLAFMSPRKRASLNGLVA